MVEEFCVGQQWANPQECMESSRCLFPESRQLDQPGWRIRACLDWNKINSCELYEIWYKESWIILNKFSAWNTQKIILDHSSS